MSTYIKISKPAYDIITWYLKAEPSQGRAGLRPDTKKAVKRVMKRRTAAAGTIRVEVSDSEAKAVGFAASHLTAENRAAAKLLGHLQNKGLWARSARDEAAAASSRSSGSGEPSMADLVEGGISAWMGSKETVEAARSMARGQFIRRQKKLAKKLGASVSRQEKEAGEFWDDVRKQEGSPGASKQPKDHGPPYGKGSWDGGITTSEFARTTNERTLIHSARDKSRSHFLAEQLDLAEDRGQSLDDAADWANAFWAYAFKDPKERARIREKEQREQGEYDVREYPTAGKDWYHLTKAEQNRAWSWWEGDAEYAHEMPDDVLEVKLTKPLFSALRSLRPETRPITRAMAEVRHKMWLRDHEEGYGTDVSVDVDELAAFAVLAREVLKPKWGAGSAAKRDAKKLIAHADKVKRSL